ncbi:TetR/AcrR family transcriptional regulator [Streptomyces pacificus]|uniref:TetR/AcrR family transcriptional regulator n=1 Tax=Streptomyces pacificus TaxID=2705029 RepID=A0A6A0AR24_9ACTN|nr:TetR/AcrR family transcriptional regulator [Streptomyces pacificus]GFH35322.1 TetR/AcrR family transcriptional regulator [Streptomyces pacificus]
MSRTVLTREQVLQAADDLVRQHGPDALTMRGLAARLGTAVTSIYWHVGNRESLLDALVERAVEEIGAIQPAGRTPATRIVSVARRLRGELRARPHLIAMVHERGLTERVFLPAQRALVREAHTAGLRGARAAEAVRAVQFQVVGFVLVECARELAPAEPRERPRKTASARKDPALARALARPADPERLFTASMRALVKSLLAQGNA